MEHVNFLKEGNGFTPADFVAQEAFDLIAQHREVLLEWHTVRSPKQNRWFWALMNLVVKNQELWPRAENLVDALKIETGHVKTVVRLGGKVDLIPASIAFGSMNQDSFNAFVERCLWLLQMRLDVDVRSYFDETNRMMGGYANKGKIKLPPNRRADDP